MSTREIPIDENGLYAVVDECDYELVMRFNSWCRVKAPTIRENYHVRCHHRINGRRWPIWLHRVVLLGTGLRPPSKWHTMCDHIDGDGLNCRRGNLRWNTRSGNAKNDPRFRASVSVAQLQTFTLSTRRPDLTPAEYKILRSADPRAYAGAQSPVDVVRAAASYGLFRSDVLDRASVDLPF
jgi:hypothetical protein